MPRNPDWVRDEIILTLDLYFRCGRNWLPEDHPEVILLSDFLKELRFFPASLRNNTFRSPNGVSMKLANFLAIDPEYPGKGLSAGSKLDQTVWDEFSGDQEYLGQVARAIRSNLRDKLVDDLARQGAIEVADDEEFGEGKLLTRLHLLRERNSRIVRKKKQEVLQNNGRLTCEVCEFDFAEVYGEIGRDYAECHHRIPISELQPNAKTKTSDLAIVCANCHRMLHRSRPVLTIIQLHEIVQKRRAADLVG